MNMMNQDINLSDALPEDETSRQYYYIEKARLYVQELSSRIGRPLTFCVTTFGCQMNARDSEKLRGILREIGYLEAEEDQADFVIYNTCTVRENANTRVYGRLGQLKPRKKKKSPYDDRPLRMYDAGTGGDRKAEEKLSFCGHHLRHAQHL